MKILFVCTGNTCRSPMAEGILNELGKKKGLDFEALSAGIFAMDGAGPAKNAIDAMKGIDIDISNHISGSLDRDLIEEVDLILTMSKGHRDSLISYYPHIESKVFILNDYAHGIRKDIKDPYGMGIDDYIKARDEIYRAVERIINDSQAIDKR